MLRIGGNWYVLHAKITCVEVSKEEDTETNLEGHNTVNKDQSAPLVMINDKNHVNQCQELSTDQCSNECEQIESKYKPNTDSPIEDVNPLQNVEVDMLTQSNMKIEIDENQIEEMDYLGIQMNDANDSQPNIQTIFQCPVCQVILKHKSSLERHILRVHSVPPKPYKCDECETKFVTIYELRRHMNKRPRVCETCNESFCSVSLLRAHAYTGCTLKNIVAVQTLDSLNDQKPKKRPYIKRNSNEVPTCDVCLKTFSRRDYLSHHYKRVHDPSSKQHKCDQCGQLFIEEYLIQHKQQIVICNKCGDTFCSKALLRSHQSDYCNLVNKDTIMNRLCKFGCNELVNANKWIHHMTIKHNDIYKTFRCDICKKSFTTKSNIRLHILSTHCPKSRKYKCDLCNYSCISAQILFNHKKFKHLNPNKFICSECGKEFKQKNQLLVHINRHTGAKPFECLYDGCSKRFNETSQRYEHMRMHTGEKPFVCPVCGHKFAYYSSLRRHKFSAHKIYTKKHPCPICDEILPEALLLKRHMRKHDVG